MVLALTSAGQAFAQCSPDPTQTNATTICAGTDADGLVVTTYGTTVSVPKGAVVRSASDAAAIAIRLPSERGGSPVTVDVAGEVNGGTAAGVSLIWQSPVASIGYYNAFANMAVASDASVTGNNAILIGVAQQQRGTASLTLVNAGRLTGTSGTALLSTAPTLAFFQSITNQQTGFIGGISGPVGTLFNAGTIDGGTRSAVDWTPDGSSLGGALANTGLITSNSAAATLANLPSGRTLTNSGTIVNLGTGAALSGRNMQITNAAAGQITSAGTAAIRTNFVNLVNAGTVTGDVIVTVTPDFISGSTVDSTAGTITGNVLFGSANDTLIARYVDGRYVTGITGTIDGGAGTDTMRVRFAADATVNTPAVLPTAFEQLALAPEAQVTATLTDGFSGPATIAISGSGTVINRTTLQSAINTIANGQTTATFINAGELRTPLGSRGSYGISIQSSGGVQNTGSVFAGDYGVFAGFGTNFANTGTVTARLEGVRTFNGQFSNTGEIRSSEGTGVTLFNTGNATNAGRIEGALEGVRLVSGALVNTGVVTSAGTGIALDRGGTLDNRAGGVVTGGTVAVGGSGPILSTNIVNAGTINGDVRLASNAGGMSFNRYFAQTGGVLNGNLTLGAGDALITDLGSNTGPGTFAGINGTVSAQDAVLRYRVRQNGGETLGTPAGFQAVGYDLYDDAVLTLDGTSTKTLNLAGTGQVELTVDIAADIGPAVAITNVLVAPGMSVPTNALSIVSRGTLSTVRRQGQTATAAPVSLGTGTNSFTNAGTISATDLSGSEYGPLSAIAGSSQFDSGNTVVNTGTIRLDGATGVSAVGSLTNSGSILQAPGGRAAVGVRSVENLTNSGTINVAGTAVVIGFNTRTITNSGEITSSSGPAVSVDTFTSSSNLIFTNLAGGTITGGTGQPAVRMSGGTLDNAGRIDGSVDLGQQSFGGATYIANGGTIAGDLRFSSANDTLEVLNGVVGVRGTVDGGNGNDLLIHRRTISGDVTLGLIGALNFEREAVRVLGVDTVATIRAAEPIAYDINLLGDGRVVNTATLRGRVTTEPPFFLSGPTLQTRPPLAAFTNEGVIEQTFIGSVGEFTNTGSIGSATLQSPAVSIYAANNSGLTFRNEGAIVGGNRNAVDLTSRLTIDASNSGTIAGLEARVDTSYLADPAAAEQQGRLAFTNTGTIASSSNLALLLQTSGNTANTVSLDNSGTIESTGASGTAARLTAGGRRTDPPLTGLTLNNSGTIRANAGGRTIFDPYAGASVPQGNVASPFTFIASAVNVGGGPASITNAAGGTLEATGAASTAIFTSNGSLTIANAGTIRGGTGTILASNDGLTRVLGSRYLAGAVQTTGNGDDRIENTGSIIGSVSLGAGNDSFENRGIINGDIFLGAGDDRFLHLASATLIGTVDGGEGTDGLVIDSTGGGTVNGDQFVNFERFSQVGQGNVTYLGSFRSSTIEVGGGSFTVDAGNTVSSTGAVTVTGTDGAETLVNAGTIAGGVALGGGDDRVDNSGSIGGDVSLADGNDRFASSGSVAGAVSLGEGDNRFDNRGTILGGVSAGSGNDVVSNTGGGIGSDLALGDGDNRLDNAGPIGGSVSAGSGSDLVSNAGSIGGGLMLGNGDNRLDNAGTIVGGVNAGSGSDLVSNVGSIGVGLVLGAGDNRLDNAGTIGGSVSAGSGSDLVSNAGSIGGDLALGDGNNRFDNAGTIGGGVSAGSGNDVLVNTGTIQGAAALGSGDDRFVEGAGSRVAGGVDGGEGRDVYTVQLSGDRAGIGARTGFEQLALEGNGTLSLTLDQNFANVSLAGNGLNLALGGFRVDAVSGSDAVETLQVDGDLPSVALAGGDDRLAIGATAVAGRLDGGAGNDVLRLTAPGGVTLSGSAVGFEQVQLTGPTLNLAGTLGAAGQALAFGAGDQQVNVVSGGTLAGNVDLGAGNDSLRVATGGVVNGTVTGGAGRDTLMLELAGNQTLANDRFTGFEMLGTEGFGTLTLAGTHAFDRVAASDGLTVGAGASLTAGQVQFGGGDNRFTINGGFAGSVDGGAGTDTVTVAAGTASAPVAFNNIAAVERFAMTSGNATISGTAALGSVEVGGGRLTGLAGSTIGGTQILVRQGATFDSAGTVNGNLAVAGTLGTAALPGTLTVNGNVALQNGSTTLFQLTPTASDKLLVNGSTTIAPGATLQIAADGAVRPGTSYDLIVASGGITGSFATVLKPDSVFGFLIQRTDRIQLLGQFLAAEGASEQVDRSIAYTNATLAAQPASSTLFDALPGLLTAAGTSDPAGFARLTPEAYASATQIGVDNALVLAGTARGSAFATASEDTDAFTFGTVMGSWNRLSADAQAGTGAANNRSYGFLGGVGVGNASWSVGAFAGFLNNRQRIDSLDARTEADGVVAGVHGRLQAASGFGVTASILYNGGDARTERSLPGSSSASGEYDLSSWMSDVSVSYDLNVVSGWTLRPRVGVTVVRTTREGTAETGTSPFGLTVARDTHEAGFVDAGVSFARSDESDAAFRPFVSLGARSQVEGRRTDAVAGFSGGDLGLVGLGAQRAKVVGTAAAGLGYRLPSGLDLFAAAALQTGSDDHRESVSAGARLRF